MKDENVQEMLVRGLSEINDSDEIDFVRTYESMGMLTNDKGLVVRMNDGSEFQVSIVRSRNATNPEICENCGRDSDECDGEECLEEEGE